MYRYSRKLHCLNMGSMNRSQVGKWDTYDKTRCVNPYSRDIARRFYSFWSLLLLNRLLVWHTEPHHKKIVNSVLNSHHKLIITSYPSSSYLHEMIYLNTKPNASFQLKMYLLTVCLTLLERVTLCLTFFIMTNRNLFQ